MQAPSLLRRAVRYSVDLLALRPEDVLLASYPRSGSTWLRFILCHLLFLREEEDRAVDFPLLNALMPELGQGLLRRRWLSDWLPRVVKSHRPYSHLYKAQRTILLLRDPRDVMVSRYYYEAGRRSSRFEGSFQRFLRHAKLGLVGWCEHACSWRERAGFVARYEELHQNPMRSLESILSYLGLSVPGLDLELAIQRSRFDRIRRIEEAGGLGGGLGRTDFRDGFRFARQGQPGDWRRHFEPADLDLVYDMTSRYQIGDLVQRP